MYLLDACQSAGQMVLDVRALNCDILTGTGRKFLRGPRGTGFMYIRKDFIEQLDPPFIDLHSAIWTHDNQFAFLPNAKRFENWESFYAGRIGLMQAVRYANDLGLDRIQTRVTVLAQRLREQLSQLQGVAVHDLGVHKCGIVTITKKGVSSDSAARQLSEIGINVSVSQLSSVHYFNTEEEIEQFVLAIDSLSVD